MKLCIPGQACSSATSAVLKFDYYRVQLHIANDAIKVLPSAASIAALSSTELPDGPSLSEGARCTRLAVWCRLGLDCSDKLRRKLCGQALNDIEKLHDFLLAQGVNLGLQQFYFKFRLHIYR